MYHFYEFVSTGETNREQRTFETNCSEDKKFETGFLTKDWEVNLWDWC